MAARVWRALSAVPLAIMVNDRVLGITVVTERNGAAGMEVFGRAEVPSAPPTAIGTVPGSPSTAGLSSTTSSPTTTTWLAKAPDVSVFLSRMAWSFLVAPPKMDDVVIVKCVERVAVTLLVPPAPPGVC